MRKQPSINSRYFRTVFGTSSVNKLGVVKRNGDDIGTELPASQQQQKRNSIYIGSSRLYSLRREGSTNGCNAM